MRRLLNNSGAALALSFLAVLAARAGAAEAIDASYPAGRVEEVVVETAAGAVSLVAGGDKSVRVTAPATGDECAMSAGVGGGVLTLVARGPAKKMFALDKTCAAGFTIRAPAGIRIKVRTITGSVDVG
ncbi:MAG: hypothetical protein KGL74_14775, partial [Elusimicrobia bacterium]|nr:hypothetical protein [Elusimicrobiota bacterium]